MARKKCRSLRVANALRNQRHPPTAMAPSHDNTKSKSLNVNNNDQFKRIAMYIDTYVVKTTDNRQL